MPPRPPMSPQSLLMVLNRQPAALRIGRMRVEIMYHGYAAELVDNQPHRHSFFEVCLVGRGTGSFMVAGQAQPIGAGSLFIARPGVEHRIVSTSRPAMELSWIAYQFHRDGAAQPGVLDTLLDDFATSPAVVVADDGRCMGLWQTLHIAAAGAELSGAAEQIGYLTAALLIGIAQAVAPITLPAAAPDRHHTLLQRALRYVDDNLHRPLSPGEVASEVGLSQRHFTRLFREHSGTTLAGYVGRARVDRARARLRSEDVPIKQIAAELGFHDIHYFTRIFTRLTGVPPGSLRRGRQPGVRAIKKHGEFV